MKRIYLLLALLVANAVSVVMAQKKSVQIGDLYYQLYGDVAYVDVPLNGTPYANQAYTIPARVEYNGLVFTVTSILENAFSDSKLNSIELPNTLRLIEPYAFKDCSNLTSIIIPSSVETIYEGAFSFCKNLTSVVFQSPSSVTTIGGDAFRNCNLTTMVIPASVKKMADHPSKPDIFTNCDFLRTLIFLPSNGPFFWYPKLHSTTYIPSYKTYKSTMLRDGAEKKVIEMLTFTDTTITYGKAVDIHDCKVNIADCGYELAGLTAKHGLHTEAGEWCDTLHAQFTNAEADVPVLDVDIPFHHTVAKAKLTAKVVSTSRQYGEENPTFKVVYTGFVNNENESVLEEPVTVSVNADKNSPAGTYAISLSGGKAKNYDIAYEPGVLTVTKALLTARVKNAERTYGEPNPDFQIEYTGLKNGETAPVWSTQPTLNTTATERSNVGDYAITATGGVPRDYELTGITSGRLTVTKAPLQVKAESAQRFYYEQNPALRCVYSGFVNGDNEAALTKQPTVTTTAAVTSKAGSYPITVSGGTAQNYDFDYVDGTLTIMKRSLTVTSPDYERTYNENNPEIKLSYTGFVNNETENVLTQKPTAAFAASKTSDVGVYPTLISGGEADNYDFVYNGGTLTITKADQTLTWEQDLSQIKVGSQIELNATASSGLDVTYLVPDNNFVSLYKAGTRTLLDCYGTGTLIIRAVQEGNKNYYSSERLSKTLTIVSTTGISDIVSDGYKLSATSNTIHISDLPEGVEARIYAIDGALLYQGHDGKVNVPSGTYIVVVGDKRTKIFVK